MTTQPPALNPGDWVRVTQYGRVLDDQGSIEYKDAGTVEVITPAPAEHPPAQPRRPTGKSTMDTVILGAGALNWHPDERRTDRYGTVHLNRVPRTVDHDATAEPERFDAAPVGAHGRLVAVIVDSRPARHTGDLIRGIAPNPAPVGTEITLGTGTLFVEASPHGNTEIGVRPDDDRDYDWLDPTALYRCHGQTVRLELRP